MQNIIR